MLLIKNGLVIDSQTDELRDILVENGKIKVIDKCGLFNSVEVLETVDAKGMWVLPGLVDLHVHLREPGLEWKETVVTGAKAAISGGYTTICAMPNSKPTNDSAEVTKYILEKAKLAGLAKVLPIGSVSIGLKGEQMSPLSELLKAGCVAFSDDGEPIHNSGLMRRALEWCLMHDAVICCHEEDKCLSCSGCMNESSLSYKLGLKGMPTLAEDVMIARDIEIARYTGGRVHICHISSPRSVELVRRAKNDGIKVTCEVTPHHLTLTENTVVNYDSNYKMSPPLRTEEDRQALIAGLKDGTIDAVASDHAPHEMDSKLKSFDEATMGILGLQTSLPLLIKFCKDGTLSKKQLVKVLASNPAKIFNLEQGDIKVGAPADFAIVNPDSKWVFDKTGVFSKSINSPFLGQELEGQADTVIVDGKILLKNQTHQQNKDSVKNDIFINKNLEPNYA